MARNSSVGEVEPKSRECWKVSSAVPETYPRIHHPLREIIRKGTEGGLEERITILISRKRIKYASTYRNEMTSNCFRPPQGWSEGSCRTRVKNVHLSEAEWDGSQSPFSSLNPQCHRQNRRHIPKIHHPLRKIFRKGTWWEGVEEGIAILISRKRIKYASAYRNEMTWNCFRRPQGVRWLQNESEERSSIPEAPPLTPQT
ncbi:hypothetical protein CEXT_320131 [Caerostris extrusa]|uniref:Uncharacterized protein n=1 Tax=Caerostris extrusa TaxID=172846 RepID=A0AAV4WZD6_CAEEX|nr:hypothetical protein CEXT_320131 [Caerostris extrusa]